MIKIYNKNELKNIKELITDSWSFPINEIDYLLEEHNNESFVLIDNGLYEIEEDIIKTNQIIEFNSLKSKLRTQLSVLKNKAINGGMSISTYIDQKMAILCNIEVIDKELDKLINDKNSK